LRVPLQRWYVRIALSLIAVGFCGFIPWVWENFRHPKPLDDYMPHAYCFLWNRHLIDLHVFSDACIAFAYFIISAVLLLIVWKNRKLIPFAWMFVAFGGFIVACGITHVMSIWVLWQPHYWLEGEIKLVTAAVSLTTACLLPTLIPSIRKLLVNAEATERAREQSEQAYTFTRSIIESSTFAILVTDPDGRITNMNPAAERLLWFTSSEMVNQAEILRVFDPQDVQTMVDAVATGRSGTVVSGFEALTAKARKGLLDEGERAMVRKDASRVPVHVTVTSLAVSGDRAGYMFTALDITERLRSQEHIRHIATHDSLTGLPSRVLFHDRLEMALSRARRYGGEVAVLMVDLDNFKRINDTLGHHAGDETLIITAHRLQHSVRQTDTVARMGGDEFMVILNDVKRESVDEVANTILKNVSAPILLGSHEVYVTASIGVSMATVESDASALFANTDIALYKSKADGKNQIHYYSDDMTHATLERLHSETRLRQAVKALSFTLLFQPQIMLSTMEILGFEALLRSPQPDGSVVMPDVFIPIAEDTGVKGGVKVDQWGGAKGSHLRAC
jgi:diguanylate cyclase (GGDEF)-like protein/PAS domain S-box-containing protein